MFWRACSVRDDVGYGMALEWIAVDWGTSNLRAWAMDGARPIEMRGSDDGMGKLAPTEFEAALIRVVGPWLSDRVTPVLACGMVGARQGWHEAPYRAVPCTPLGEVMAVATSDPRIAVSIAPGLSQAAPADVMRGEETQIAGVLALLPGFDGVICLPGTHCKWAHVSAGEVVSFQTFMTGELFALLSTQSVLRHGMASDAWDDAAFEAGLAASLSHPNLLAARLFTLRAEGLLAGLSADAARSRLSGLLIGAELAAARPYWLGQRVVLVGAAALSDNYRKALAVQGVTADILDATGCTLAGLSALYLNRKAAK